MPPVCGLVILMAASPQGVPYQGLDRELAMTLTLLVPLAMDVPLFPPPIDPWLVGSEGFQGVLELIIPPANLSWWESFSRFGHQGGRLHRTSALATGFFREVPEARRGCLPETEEPAGWRRRPASSTACG